jgi:flagellar biosynthesis/type III secretory pathway chaperone
MAEPYAYISELLTELLSALDDILRLSREKRRCIIENDTIGLETVVSLEVRALNKIRAYEKKRVAFMPELAAFLELPARKINVTTLTEKASPQDSEALDKLRNEIKLRYAEIKKLNEESKSLIEAHLEYTETMMNLMVDSEDPLNNFYSGDGTADTDKKKMTGFFDRQI